MAEHSTGLTQTFHFRTGRVEVKDEIGGQVVSVFGHHSHEPLAVVCTEPDEKLPDGPNDPDYPDMMEEGDK